jgi:hypothetical protein
MAFFNDSNLTFTMEEIKGIDEAIVERMFSRPQISEFHTVYDNIVKDRQIVFLPRFNGLIGKVQDGLTCHPATNPGTITPTEKKWLATYIEDRFEFCFRTLLKNFFVYALKSGVNKSDLTGTDFMNYVADIIGDELAENLLYKVWFNDTAAAHFNGSPAGFITNGTDLDYIDSFDGIWKQIFTIAAASPAQRVLNLNTKNTQATYALQKFSAADTTNLIVTRAMRDMVKDADTRLSSAQNAVFLVTKSVFDQLGDERTYAAGNAVSEAYRKFEDGFRSDQLDGIPVIECAFMDRFINQYQNSGTNWFRPHRIVLTTAEQLGVGTESTANLNELDIFHDKKDKKVYLDLAFNLDAKFLEDYMLMTAY